MLTFKNRKLKRGRGFVDNLISAVTSNTMKKVGEEVGKKAMTEIGNRAVEKVVDKILPKNRHILNEHLKENQVDRYRRGEPIDVEELFRKK